MKKTFITFCLLIFVIITTKSFAMEVPVGNIAEVINTVKITSKDGSERTAKKNDPVFLMDRIKTEKDAKIKILFNNENIIVLGFESELTINELVYNEEDKESRSFFELIMGKVRAIVKKLKPKSQFKIKVANSDIGVLGTDFIVIYNREKRIIEAFVDEGSINISDTKKRWSPVDIETKHYTKIEEGTKPEKPEPYNPEVYDPVKDELTIYEDPATSPGNDYSEYIEGAGDETIQEDEGLDPEPLPAPDPFPEEGQEPLTGTVKVKVTTIFP